ncbi:hypothetical protein NECID01_0109 [Nematocida sp. AWRm77]|nr:hypothetical protein NECID01_0109 [Nematocida sp. AWRm77]
MKISRTPKDKQLLFAPGSIENRLKSLSVQMLGMCGSTFIYLRTGWFLFWFVSVYFIACACGLFFLVLLTISYNNSTRRKAEKESAKQDVKIAPEVFRMPERAPPEPAVEKKKETINFRVMLKKKNATASTPSKRVIKKYSEYKDNFGLTKDLEKEFKSWIYFNVICPASDRNCRSAREAYTRGLTKSEIDDLRLVANNGFICYDKNNENHSKAMFKVLYNYFNTHMPTRDSYYANPMDEFVFDDIGTMKISPFGLLVEDTELLLEGRKMFNVYFMDRHFLYDTEGNVILAFLLLLIFSNENMGMYLGSLSLRMFKFLP